MPSVGEAALALVSKPVNLQDGDEGQTQNLVIIIEHKWKQIVIIQNQTNEEYVKQALGD